MQKLAVHLVRVLVGLLMAVSLPVHAETFLSISDIHFDPFADPTLIPKLEAADVSQWEEILASSGVKTFSTYGSDINDALFRSAIAEMKSRIASPAFVLISGDFFAHGFQKTYQQYATDKGQAAYTAFVTKTVAYVAGALQKTYPGIPIYPTLGNNDSDCGDYAVVPNGVFLANFRDVWKTAVQSRSFERRFPTGGYYHADVPSLKDVRIIALNTNFFSTNYKNPCGTPGGPDPGLQQLVWLEDELRLARALGKRVWLLYHIPPGMDVYDIEEWGGACPGVKGETFWKDDYQQRYLAITNRYRNTILGSWAGHTHQDEFRIATGDFIHITPSVTPVFGNNPAFEVVEVKRNGEVSGYTAHHLPNVTLPWAREYAFAEAYDKGRYDTGALTQIASAIQTDPATRQQYFTYLSSGAPKSTAGALAKWQGYWCGLTIMNPAAFTNCYCEVAPHANAEFQKRIEEIDSRLREKHGMTTEQTAVGVLDLQSPRVAMVHPDRIEYAASVPKIGILLAYFQLHPEAAATLDAATAHELALMVKASSNELAAKHSRAMGLREIQQVLNEYGFYDASRGGGLWVGKHYGPNSERIGDPVADHSHAATVRQLLRFYWLLDNGGLVSPAASQKMRELFLSTAIPHDDHKFVRALADRNVKLLRKWGSWQDYLHDTALVEAPDRRYVLVALTHHAKGDAYLEDLARAVDDLMRGQ
jgi:hypothetical protein